MCGIFVYRGLKLSLPIHSSLIDSITAILSLRGPDEQRYLKIETNFVPIYLVGTRLKIVGSKSFPLQSTDVTLLVANGEIYNYQELFNELIKHILEPDNNDFIVVLELYRKYKQLLQPIEAFRKTLLSLKGDFAIVLIDQTEKIIYIARDYPGIRPLWYIWDNQTSWGISSERYPLEMVDFNSEAIIQVKPGFFGYFSYAEDVKPGTNIQWEPLFTDMCKNIPLIRSSSNEITLDIATRTILDQLEKSLYYHFQNITSNINQVIGIFLSGGIDSTILYQLIRKTNQNIIPISTGFPESSDLKALNILLHQNDQKWVIDYLSIEKIREHLPKLLTRLKTRSPVDIAIAMPLYFLTKKARELGIKICITGQGADELFGGYQRYETLWNTQHLEELNTLLWHDLQTIALHNLERDDLVASLHGIELRLPYLDLDLIRYVTSLPLPFLFQTEDRIIQRKHLLRRIGYELGITKEILYRKKVAIQYGSGFQKILAKLAHEENLTINEYLLTF